MANAVYDGTSVVMLSGETATGKYPVRTVETMASICEETEKNIDYYHYFHETDFKITNNIDAISYAACSMASGRDAKASTVCSISGYTARMVSRFRPNIDIIGLTTSDRVWRKLSLSWGVIPILSEEYLSSSDVLFYTAEKITKNVLNLKKGDNIIIVGGSQSGKSGSADTIRLEKV